VIMELGKGEALVSLLEGNGTPTIVDRAMICPPAARIGPVTPEERKAVIAASPCAGKYDKMLDAESAYEVLQSRAQAAAAPPAAGAAPPAEGGGLLGGIGAALGGLFGTSTPRGQRLSTTQLVTREVTRSVVNRVAGQVAADLGKSILGKQMGGTIGRAIVRGTLGGVLRR